MSREDLYIWCGRRICQQREDDGATVVRNYYRQGFAAGEDTFVYVRDHLDSVQAVVGEDGETFESARRYSPWGETRETSGAGEASDFGYTGHLDHGPSGVVLAQYRGYDARLGRWLNRDPFSERGGLNLHGYARNAPIDFADPDGRNPFALIGGLLALGYYLGSSNDGATGAPPDLYTGAEAAAWYVDKKDDLRHGGDGVQPPGTGRPPVPGDTGPPGQPTRLDYYHCMLNCEATQRGPEHQEVARSICDLNEVVDTAMGKEDGLLDEASNEWGRQVPPGYSCDSWCR